MILKRKKNLSVELYNSTLKQTINSQTFDKPSLPEVPFIFQTDLNYLSFC